MSDLFPIFPTPILRAKQVLGGAQAASLSARLIAAAATPNKRSGELLHTQILSPKDDPELAAVALAITPHLEQFGALLFGERLRWRIKEIWGNVLQPGGRQSVHNHANSFISGVLYLTESDPSAQTVFIRSLGGHDYVFSNVNARTELGPFNADKWIAPAPEPGDLVLFPSYLLHEVPPNRGALRVTLPFNAIPHRLESWGYGVSFGTDEVL